MAKHHVENREANLSPTERTMSSDVTPIQNDTGTSHDSDTLTPFKTPKWSKSQCSQSLTSFQDPYWQGQKIKSQVYGPCEWGKFSHFRSWHSEDSWSSERTALDRSTTKRIEIQPHLHRARFNIDWEHQRSTSIVPKQFQLHRRHVRWISTSRQTRQSYQPNTGDTRCPLSTKQRIRKN